MTANQTGRGAGSSIPDGAVVHPGAPASPRQWVIRLPYDKPPLNANRKRNIYDNARIVKQLRHDAGWAVRGAGVPALSRCRVELHYVPAIVRDRDTDNLWPTVKPSADGIVDAGVVAKDTPAYMVKPEPVIHPVQKSCDTRLYLVITDLGGAA